MISDIENRLDHPGSHAEAWEREKIAVKCAGAGYKLQLKKNPEVGALIVPDWVGSNC